MIFKLILFIVSIVIFIFYAGFNLDNRCDIWLFFTTLKNVPVFMNSLICFALGILCALPVAFLSRMKKNNKEKKIEKSKSDETKIKPDSDLKSIQTEESKTEK